MDSREQAKIILKNLDKSIQIDWNFQDTYLKAIEAGLNQVKKVKAQQEATTRPVLNSIDKTLKDVGIPYSDKEGK